MIEVEDSEAIGEPVELGEDAFAEAGGDVFAAEEGEALALDEGEAIAIDEEAAPVGAAAAAAAYEVPFTTLQCLVLMSILLVMGVGGMLMTDLVRNMWTYSETSAPVSSLTNALVGLMGWN